MGIKPLPLIFLKGFSGFTGHGIVSGKKLDDFIKSGWSTLVFAIVIPLINGIVVAYLSQLVTDDVGNRFIFAILAASASYIAVPAAMKMRRQKPIRAVSTHGLSCYFSIQYYFWNAYIPVYYSKFLKRNSCTEKQKKSK
jgi:hypothetical protein